MGRFRRSPFAPCPSCGADEAEKVGFTWWGGAVGPAMLTHVRCGQCGAGYNGRTGRPNTAGIIGCSIALGFILLLGAAFGLLILMAGLHGGL